MSDESILYTKPISRELPDRASALAYGTYSDTIDALEKALTPGSNTVGERFSAADVYLSGEITWGFMTKSLEPRPVVTEYVRRHAERQAFKRYEAGLPSFVHNANVLTDKGYDSDVLIAALEVQSCIAIVPPRACRAGRRRKYDTPVYKERFVVECFFQKIKRNRRISMRFEKLSAHFLGMLTLAAALIWTL